MATGLAWTPHGGDILFIEAARMPGKGGLVLTGQLGDVMRESAQIALSLARSTLQGRNGEPAFDFSQYDIHIHVPAGGIPKDGPSAGVTLVAALSSLLKNEAIDPQLGMTGEITLRGVVLPVGGIKEKLVAAHRAGLSTILLPTRNAPDLEEVPARVLEALHIEYVSTIDDVLAAVFRPKVKEAA
jgi:ATP-dependent Lon protease